MKLTQISDHIWSLRAWVLIPIHVWLVVEKDGLTLVDAGIPTMAGGIERAVAQLQAGPIKRIALTHGHSDHVGALKRLLASSPIPVYANRIEIPYLEGKLPYRPKQKAAAVLPAGTIRGLEEEQGVLQPLGSLVPYHAPGHSPGHTVYYHQADDVLLAGDLFWSKKGKLMQPRFTPDIAEAVRSSEIVARLQPRRLEVCHGDSVFDAAQQIPAYMRGYGAGEGT